MRTNLLVSLSTAETTKLHYVIQLGGLGVICDIYERPPLKAPVILLFSAKSTP